MLLLNPDSSSRTLLTTCPSLQCYEQATCSMPRFSLKMAFLGLFALVALAGMVEASWIQEISGWEWYCIADTNDNHYLQYKYILTSSNSPQNCVHKCTEENGGNVNSGMIGVKKGNECWCSWNTGYLYPDNPSDAYSYNGEECKSRVCPGDSSAVCGATAYLLAYRYTG